VKVPLDRRSGTAQLSLSVQRLTAGASEAGTLIVLPGGPGQSATAQLGELRDALDPAVRRRWNVVAFDPRGTGGSDPVRCPEMQDDPTLRSTVAGAACARTLGSRLADYTTWDNVEDLEAVRASLGADRIALYGTSYGTRVAMGYAAAYPQHVQRLVLDSVVAPDGPTGVELQSFAAMRRILGHLCRGRCGAFTRNLLAETAELAARLRAAPMSGMTFDSGGVGHPRSIDAAGLYDLLLDADLMPAVRVALPAAIVSARRGDPAALLRLAAVSEFSRLPELADFSAGLYAATNCAELQPPWDPAAEISQRPAQAAAGVGAIADSAFLPFDRETALRAGLIPLCLEWPTVTPPPPSVPWQALSAPTLILAGAEDIRAPLENASQVAASVPTASVLVVPFAGHSVFGTDVSGCAKDAFVSFLNDGRRTGSCGRVAAPSVTDLPPRALSALAPVPRVSGNRGRTLRALELTLDDVAFALRLAKRGGGLRGGSFASGLPWPRLRSVQYLPGVRVSGKADARDRLVCRISGSTASRGTLVLTHGGLVRGRLGGLRVAVRLRPRNPDLG
jgi:pimeloyl-ACP methyl ester carboxylesterase